MRSSYRSAMVLLAGVALGGLVVQGLHAQAKPPVYYVSEIDVHDADAYAKEYAPKAQAVIKAAGGRFVAVGGVAGNLAGRLTTFEGEAPLADAVHLGLIASEARPGGNVTGVEPYIGGLPAKQIELAREIVPGATKIGLLTNNVHPKGAPQVPEPHAELLKSVARRGASINTFRITTDQ
jgi:ABC transporter substrate binding protein/Domain of unknown function (DUF1330)